MKIHSFSLTNQAAKIVEGIPNYRPGVHPGKSARVSDAIVWFYTSPIYGPERDDDGIRTGKLVRSSHGTPWPGELLAVNEDLSREVDYWRDKCLSNGGVKHHLVELLRSIFRLGR